MSNIEPYVITNLSPSRHGRRAANAIDRARCAGQVRSAAVDAEADVGLDKVAVLTEVTIKAMSDATRVATAQHMYEQLAPAVSGHLAFLATEHVVGVAEVTADLRQRLRRI